MGRGIVSEVLYEETFSGDLAAANIPPVSLGKTPTFIPAQTVALVFSSNIHGEIESCG